MTAETLQQATALHHATSEQSELERLLQREYNPRDMLAGDSMDKMMGLAKVMADGKTTVPKHLQGNLGDCMAVITQAMQWNMNPFAVAQKTHLVNGALGYEAQLIIAVLNSSPLLATRIAFTWADGWDGMRGKEDTSADHWCEVSARLRGEAQPRVLRVSMAQVGNVRNSPNWSSDARQQLAYLAAKRWGRLNAPDVILGVYTPDEMEYGTSDAGNVSAGSPPPPPPPARPELEAYPDDRFAANLPSWRGLIESGRRNAEDIVALASTKGVLSADQKQAIYALQPQDDGAGGQGPGAE